MSATGLDVFDKTLQKTNNWLKDLMYELNWTDRHKSYLAMRACLQSLRDRLTIDEAAHVGAQLPMLIRGFYYEGWKPAATPQKMKNKNEFLDGVKTYFEFGPELENPETVTRAVFKILYHKMSEGEMNDIKSVLPNEIAELLPQKI